MHIFSPRFEGRVQIKTPHQNFLAEFKQRIESGFLTGRPHRRSRYIVCRSTDDELSFQALGLLTAINVGLNSVNLRCTANNSVEFQVSYRRWPWLLVAMHKGPARKLLTRIIQEVDSQA